MNPEYLWNLSIALAVALVGFMCAGPVRRAKLGRAQPFIFWTLLVTTMVSLMSGPFVYRQKAIEAQTKSLELRLEDARMMEKIIGEPYDDYTRRLLGETKAQIAALERELGGSQVEKGN